MSEPLTIDEIDDKVTTLYYMQRVNYAAADEIGAKCLPIWKRLPNQSHLKDVAIKPADRAWRHLYDRAVATTKMTVSSSFENTARLHPFLAEGNWPAFKYAEDDMAEKISVWAELIGLSEEAQAVSAEILSTGVAITDLLASKPGRQAQDLRGWYVSVMTGRRSARGWVVGGRGNALHVQPDRLEGVHRMLRRPAGHTNAVTGMTAVKNIARWVYNPTDGPEVMNFSMKHATVELVLPPDMAKERKRWADQVLSTGVAHRDIAKANHAAYVKWQIEVEPITKRIKASEDWHKGLPKDFREEWIEGGSLRFVTGGPEAIDILLRLITEEELRDAMVAKHIAANPSLIITEAERALVDSPPVGGHEDYDMSLARTVRAMGGTAHLATDF